MTNRPFVPDPDKHTRIRTVAYAELDYGYLRLALWRYTESGDITWVLTIGNRSKDTAHLAVTPEFAAGFIAASGTDD